MYEFRMPSLGADMEAGTLSKWLVQPGDAVKRGDVIAIIETEKSDIEVEIFASGVVDKLLIQKGQRVPVGTLLATVMTNGEVKAAPAPAPVPPPPPVPAPVPVAAAPPPPSPVPAGLRASPAARRKAKELGIDLATLKGTGPGGAITLGDLEEPVHAPRVHPVARKMAEALGVDLSKVTGTGASGTITKADVENAAKAAQAPAPAAPEARDRAASMRRAIGAAMARSKREIPHYYLATEIDMRRALAWLEEENRQRPVEDRLLPAAVLLKAVALALRKVPELNGFWVDGAFQPSEAIHLGVAVAIRGGGLIAPAIHDTDQKSLGELMAALRDLVQRARAGTLRSSEMSDPTITVTNLGDQGVGTVFGVIYPPQVALVGLGRIAERPWAENGLLGVRPVLTATLSADHRATDGHRGGLFLAALDHLLQEPEKL
ncbi:MAG TPA: dihydrolipoamide acetyltransferase family protein [Thermoanaerobaculia bacterium]|nr:dihydrolipoamide acetyltransferase family protein [Thermoanaerobaculia bacterium]